MRPPNPETCPRTGQEPSREYVPTALTPTATRSTARSAGSTAADEADLLALQLRWICGEARSVARTSHAIRRTAWDELSRRCVVCNRVEDVSTAPGLRVKQLSSVSRQVYSVHHRPGPRHATILDGSRGRGGGRAADRLEESDGDRRRT